MGGGPKQVNSGQASQANAGATAAGNASAALSKQMGTQEQQMYDLLFGKNGGGGGTLSSMLDPKTLTQTGFNPAYKSQWDQSQGQISSDFANQRGSLARAFANSGATSRSTPNGFMADQMNKLSRGEADTRGAVRTGLMGQQYQDALKNFWNASNIATGNAASAGGQAVAASGNSGNTFSQLYGTAGRQAQTGTSAATGITESAVCPAEGSFILMADNSRKLIEHIRKGDLVKGIDGKPDEVLEDPMPSLQFCCEVATAKCSIIVSTTHTFVRHDGGYCFAGAALAEVLDTDHGPARAMTVATLAEKVFCRHLLLKRSHGYNANGFWNLE